ncbi:MAG TPA: thiamine pyrophosphate-binding protein [Candidatus Binataceae bacterium]|nr:thiamine pyrophosphate-binding protein [Candidatus Binataceae bacterium]
MAGAADRSTEGSSESAAADASQKISGGNLAAKALKNEGVEAIFTLCGGHIIDIYDGCLNEGIKIIDVRHEQVAALPPTVTGESPARPDARWSRRGRARPTR